MKLATEDLRDARECCTKHELTSKVEKATVKAQEYFNEKRLVRASYEIKKAFAALEWMSDLYEVEEKDLRLLREPLLELDTRFTKLTDEDS